MAWSIAHIVDSVDDDMLCLLIMANDGYIWLCIIYIHIYGYITMDLIYIYMVMYNYGINEV